MTASLIQLFERDLQRLKEEILAYPSEEHLWVVSGEITNCAGNLALHLAGNLSHFIGAILGNNGYVRDRHGEFHDKDVPRTEIIARIDSALSDVTDTLRKLDSIALGSPYPIDVFGHSMTTEYFLVHLYGHLNYHLGQVNYHRRMLTG